LPDIHPFADGEPEGFKMRIGNDGSMYCVFKFVIDDAQAA